MNQTMEDQTSFDVTDDTEEKEKDAAEKEKGDRRVPLVLIGVSVLIAGVIGYFFTLPHYQDAQAARTALTEKQTERDTKQLQLAKLIEDNKKPRELTDEEKRVIALLPDEVNVPDLIRTLDTLSILNPASSIDTTALHSFSISAAGGTGPTQSVTITGSFSSSRFALLDLLKKFETAPKRIFNVKQISISLTNRQTTTPTSIFSDSTLDTRYFVLMTKRQSFLLTESEQTELNAYQAKLDLAYQALARKRSRSENEEKQLTNLKAELNSLQAEAQYNLNVTTYVDNKAPAVKDSKSAPAAGAAKTAPAITASTPPAK